MTEISMGRKVVTLINIFTVAPENQDRLLELLGQATDGVMRKLPGFISANLHRSVDGTRVVNYAQWENREAFEAIFTNPQAVEHMAAIRNLAIGDRHLYEVVSVHGRPQNPPLPPTRRRDGK